jgi:hypothetical protein
LSDILIERNELNTSTLAAVLRQSWLIDNELVQMRAISPSVSELLGHLEENPDIRSSVRWSHRIRDVIAPSIGCALHYHFCKSSPERADQFFERLADGASLERGSPVLRLRDKLFQDRSSRKRAMSDPEKIALTIKAWNIFWTGTKIESLKWQNSGPRKEPFPQINGSQKSARGATNVSADAA